METVYHNSTANTAIFRDNYYHPVTNPPYVWVQIYDRTRAVTYYVRADVSNINNGIILFYDVTDDPNLADALGGVVFLHSKAEYEVSYYDTLDQPLSTDTPFFKDSLFCF